MKRYVAIFLAVLILQPAPARGDADSVTAIACGTAILYRRMGNISPYFIRTFNKAGRLSPLEEYLFAVVAGTCVVAGAAYLSRVGFKAAFGAELSPEARAALASQLPRGALEDLEADLRTAGSAEEAERILAEALVRHPADAAPQNGAEIAATERAARTPAVAGQETLPQASGLALVRAQ